MFHQSLAVNGLSMKNSFILLLLALPGVVSAQSTKSLSLNNTATVVSSCSISTTQNLNFGVFDPLNPQDLTGSGSVSVACTYGTYSMSVSNGTGGSGYPSGVISLPSTGGGGYTYYTSCMRSMKNSSGSNLYYELYADPGYLQSSYNSTPSSTYSSNPPSMTAKYSCSGTTSLSGFKSVSFTSKGPQTVTIYGKINNTKWKSTAYTPGAYSDQVSVNINF